MIDEAITTRKQQHEHTQQHLYKYTLEIFQHDNMQPCRVDDIATTADVSRGNFYFHFPTKEHVLLERMHETEDVVCDALEALPEDAPISDVLRVLNAQLTTIWEPDPQLLPKITKTTLHFTTTTIKNQKTTQIRHELATHFRATTNHNKIKKHIPTKILNNLYLNHILTTLLAWYGNRSLGLRTTLDVVTELFWNDAHTH